MNFIKKYWIELVLIIGYLLADNLHMIVKYYNYSPMWYTPFVEDNQGYVFHNSIFYTFHYLAQAPLLMTIVLFISSPMEINKIWMRFALVLCSLRDFLGELFEMINLKIPYFSNSGYNASCIFKICFLISAVLIAYKLKKKCMKLLNYISYV